MAIATTPRYDCSYCGGNRTPETSVKGSFCDIKCYWRHKGEGVIRQIKNDHKFCSTCYSRQKTVDKPPETFRQDLKRKNGPESAESLIGFEYLTPQVEYEHGFSYCKCGNIDHFAEIDELQEIDVADVIVNLWNLLTTYYKQDQFGDHRPNKDVLLEALKASDMDFEYAIGKAVFE